MAAAILLVAGSLFRRREPSNMSQPTRRPLRANAVPWPLLWRAWLAGTCSVVALVGYWIVLASFVQMPGSVLPDLSAYPWWTRVFAVATGATVSPLCEQLGFWGYWQETFEREFSGLTAVMITAVTFAVLPHPPAHVAFWPKWLFFFLTGLTFSTMAYITDSMLPGLVIHTGALLTFFVPGMAPRSATTAGDSSRAGRVALDPRRSSVCVYRAFLLDIPAAPSSLEARAALM